MWWRAGGRWDGQAARMEGGMHERWGVSMWGGIRTGQPCGGWLTDGAWGRPATSTQVRGGHGGGAAWTVVVVVGEGRVACRRSAWRAARGVGGMYSGWAARIGQGQTDRPGGQMDRPGGQTGRWAAVCEWRGWANCRRAGARCGSVCESDVGEAKVVDGRCGAVWGCVIVTPA